MIEFLDARLMAGAKLLFEQVNFRLDQGVCVGVVGDNGVGKSSLFATILGERALDGGDMRVPKDWRFAHMTQEVDALNKSAIDYVLMGDSEYIDLYQKLQSQSDDASLHQRFLDIGGYQANAKAAQILHGLGFNQHDHARMVGDFSGGWRMRLNLARVLMSRADVLLLDEPTNHLDLDAILWLESWIAKSIALVCVISHDQSFLDAICDEILHLDGQTITKYSGNFSQFLRTRTQMLQHQEAIAQKQAKQRAHLQSFIDRFKAKASKAKQAQSRIKQLERLHIDTPISALKTFEFSFFTPSTLKSPFVVLSEVVAGYDTPIVKADLRIDDDSRIAILGANGAGKSTLIKTLVGEIAPLSGKIVQANNLCIGYFSQHHMDAILDDDTPMLLLRRIDTQTNDTDLRAFLGAFGFVGERVFEKVALFSGGERARLGLALIVYQKPHLLVLDEPTNHLDIAMQRALIDALQNFDGALIVVSHDRTLIKSVCDNLYLLDDGKCLPFEGDLDDYANHLLQAKKAYQANASQLSTSQDNPHANAKGTDEKIDKKDMRRAAAELRQKTAPLKQKIAQDEEKLDTLIQELNNIETALADENLYSDGNKGALLQLLDKQHIAQAQVQALEIQILADMQTLETML